MEILRIPHGEHTLGSPLLPQQARRGRQVTLERFIRQHGRQEQRRQEGVRQRQRPGWQVAGELEVQLYRLATLAFRMTSEPHATSSIGDFDRAQSHPHQLRMH
jgi:hypothetical protein